MKNFIFILIIFFSQNIFCQDNSTIKIKKFASSIGLKNITNQQAEQLYTCSPMPLGIQPLQQQIDIEIDKIQNCVPQLHMTHEQANKLRSFLLNLYIELHAGVMPPSVPPIAG